MWSDDGIVLRLPEAIDDLPLDELAIDPAEIDEIVVAQLPQTAMFASRFRECAARALLLPRRRPDRRTPLWQQRQKAADLLAVAAHHPDFPILLETTRECINDVFDLPALREVLDRHPVPSRAHGPGRDAAGVAVRPVAAVRLDRRLHVRGRRAAGRATGRRAGPRSRPPARPARCRGAARADRSGRAGRPRARAAAAGRRPAGPRRRRGPRPAAAARSPGAAGRSTPGARPAPAVGSRAGSSSSWPSGGPSGSRSRATSASRRPRTRPACATRSASRSRRVCRRRSPIRSPTPLVDLVARFARTHGPFLAGQVAHRYGLGADRIARRARPARAAGPAGAGRVPSRRHRARVVRRRRAAPAAPTIAGVAAQGGRAGRRRRARPASCPSGTPSASRGGGSTRSSRPSGCSRVRPCPRRCSNPTCWRPGARLPAGRSRRALHRRRRRVGRCRSARRQRRPGASAVPRPGRPARLVRPAADRARRVDRRPTEPCSTRCGPSWRRPARRSGPSWSRPWPPRASPTTMPTVLDALWDLVWAGEVTNDSMAPLRARVGGGRDRRRRAGLPAQRRRGRAAPTSVARARRRDRRRRAARGLPRRSARGRRSVVAGRAAARAGRRRRPRRSTRCALQLLERHGVLTREAVLAEGVEGGFAGVYPVLKVLEERGQVRRGYFVAGLGAAQFALPGAVDRLRASREVDRRPSGPVVLAATDPGAAVSAPRWPGPMSAGRPSRSAGAFVVLGRPVSRSPSSSAGPRAWPTFAAAARPSALGRGAGRAWSRTVACARSRSAASTAPRRRVAGRRTAACRRLHRRLQGSHLHHPLTPPAGTGHLCPSS